MIAVLDLSALDGGNVSTFGRATMPSTELPQPNDHGTPTRAQNIPSLCSQASWSDL